ncbi:MAG: hypothetical protein J0I12_21155 [Candidatus Eremiobacteraeota bacterium]|nr:hypothetical protein [Candidatus Eremiobacteraeota bacterium]
MERVEQLLGPKTEPAKRQVPPIPEQARAALERAKKAKLEKDKKIDEERKRPNSDLDLAMAALQSKDYDSAAALVEKLRRAAHEDPKSYQLVVAQLGLLAQEGKVSAQRHKTRLSALQAFSKQVRPQAEEEPTVDRSV